MSRRAGRRPRRPAGRHVDQPTGRSRARAAGVVLLVALAPGALGACSGSDDGAGGGPGAPSSSPSPTREVVTDVHVGQVVGRLPAARRAQAARGVRTVVEGWLDAAFPAEGRPAVAEAFDGFTPGAARAARADRAALIAADGASAVRRTIGIDLLATRGHVRTATARVRLELRRGPGTGAAARRLLVARLFLTRDPRSGWTVFGYDAAQGAPRPRRAHGSDHAHGPDHAHRAHASPGPHASHRKGHAR